MKVMYYYKHMDDKIKFIINKLFISFPNFNQLVHQIKNIIHQLLKIHSLLYLLLQLTKQMYLHYLHQINIKIIRL